MTIRRKIINLIEYNYKNDSIIIILHQNNYSDADIFVKGDGEEAFYNILKNPKSILNGDVQISGVSTKQNSNETLASADINKLSSVFPINFKKIACSPVILCLCNKN